MVQRGQLSTRSTLGRFARGGIAGSLAALAAMRGSIVLLKAGTRTTIGQWRHLNQIALT